MTRMTDTDLRAYLGEAWADTTDDQRVAIMSAAEAIDARWPEGDLADSRQEALAAAVAVILGDDTLEAVATAWRQARERERRFHAAMTGAIIAAAPGQTEVALSERAGVTRVTVRKALGR